MSQQNIAKLFIQIAAIVDRELIVNFQNKKLAFLLFIYNIGWFLTLN